MYSSESVEPQRIRSVAGNINGRSSQRRTGSGSATSRLFINAVKDASKSSRGTEENSSDKAHHGKRPYSPNIDSFKEDQKTKARRVDGDSGIDKSRSHEIDQTHNRSLHIKNEHYSSDHEMYDPLSQDGERGRFVNERRSQMNLRPQQQSRSVLDRLGKKGGLMNAYINPAFFPNSNGGSDLSQSNDSITLTPKVSRCRHWPNCDLGSACKFHHPTEICPMVPNCPNSPRTCLYIHPASQDFDNRGLYRFGSYGNGSMGQGTLGIGPNAFVIDPIGQNPMGHFGIGQHGMGQGMFNPGSFHFPQSLAGTDLYSATSLRQNTLENISGHEQNFQGLRDKEQKPFRSGAGSTSVTATINTNASITATSSSVSAESVQEKDATLASNSQATPAVLCKYGERCANPNCVYAHASPSTVGTGITASSLLEMPCKYGIECGQTKCRYSHPSPANLITPCKFYPNCKNPVCPYLHMDYSNEPVAKVPTPCRNGNLCTRTNCLFMHPWDMEMDANIPCKYGYECRRPDCAYSHPMGKKDHNQPVSDRTFVSVPDELTEKVYVAQDNQVESLQDEKSDINNGTLLEQKTKEGESNTSNSDDSKDQKEVEPIDEGFNLEEDLEDLEDINFILDDVDHGEVVTDV